MSPTHIPNYYRLYYEKSGSVVRYVTQKDHVFITHIRSRRSGDAHRLMARLYSRFPGKVFKTDVIISASRKRALTFWKSEGFKIVNKIKHPGLQFYEMEKRN